MELILTPDTKKEIINQFISYLETKLNQKISIPIIFDPFIKLEELSRAEKFRLFTETMESEGPIWVEKNHPDLTTMEEIDKYVSKIRGQWIRNYE